MYDLEIVLAVCGKEKYATRLKEFKKNGIVSIEDKKVLLSLLVGAEEIKDADCGWPESLDVRIIKSSVNQCAAKMNYFYANYNCDNSKWIMRVDDDSVTNISHLMQELEKFDYRQPFYFTTQLIEGDVSVEKSLLHAFDSKHKKKTLFHEIECCVVSNECYKKIRQNEFCLKILKIRAEIEFGFTDICLAACARECEINLTELHKITHEADVRKFLENNVFHVHYLAPDVNNQQLKIITNKREDLKYINEKLFVCNHKQNQIGYFILRKNGIVDSNISNLNFWTIEESNIGFYNEEKWIEKNGKYAKHSICELQMSVCKKTLNITFSKNDEHKCISNKENLFFI